MTTPRRCGRSRRGSASIASLTGARPEESGLVSGINNAAFQIGAALGIAVASSVAFACTPDPGFQARTDGFQAGFAATAIFAAVGLLTALLLLLTRRANTAAAADDQHLVSTGH
ncbi:hypothetical protein ACWZHB_05290 [Nocardia sp. FBN12]|uniref:hypothetical protein n=1 Tax=Nocardia sp. FBN12 TaxID=3419766 RepID=UPI003D014E33